LSKKSEQSYVRRLERRKRAISRIFLFLSLVVLVLLAALFIGATLSGETGAVSVATAAVLYIIGDKFLGLSDRFSNAAKWASKGAKAEEDVAAILSGFRTEDYFVLNDIRSPTGNVDHLVIARNGGVYIIETKSQTGTVDVQGDELLLNGEIMLGDPILQTLRNAMWLKDKVGEIFGDKPYVTAILLFTNAYVNARKPVRNVMISRPQFLHRVLNSSGSTKLGARIWANRKALEQAIAPLQEDMAA